MLWYPLRPLQHTHRFMADSLFKVSFVNQSKVYEIYARAVYQSDMIGFIEVEEFIFGENTTVVIDPSEDRLKTEFADVKRSYIPMHSIIRIDEVEKRGTAKILAFDGKAEDIYRFPGVSQETTDNTQS